jgi:multicomponent Na+:H+ antiporter subunit G
MFADIITVALIFLGSAFSLLAAVGIVRMPDLYTRMQSATKAGTLGVACVVLAAAVHFQTASVTVEVAMITIFLFATAPIASHLIARAAYHAGVPLWDRTIQNDLSAAMLAGKLTEQEAGRDSGETDSRS